MTCRELRTYEYTCDGWLSNGKPCDRQKVVTGYSRLYTDAVMTREHSWTESGIDQWLCPFAHGERKR
jgi:hypothetical protein